VRPKEQKWVEIPILRGDGKKFLKEAKKRPKLFGNYIILI
jgi:hypothetical protein